MIEQGGDLYGTTYQSIRTIISQGKLCLIHCKPEVGVIFQRGWDFHFKTRILFIILREDWRYLYAMFILGTYNYGVLNCDLTLFHTASEYSYHSLAGYYGGGGAEALKASPLYLGNPYS